MNVLKLFLLCAAFSQCFATVESIKGLTSKKSCPADCVSWFDGCNTCGCKDGKITYCTLKYCKKYGKAFCKKKSCPKNCLKYFDGCNNCDCKNGIVGACTKKYCPFPKKPRCTRYAPVVKKCPKNCVSWFDGCNTCSCKNGIVGGCTKKYCRKHTRPRCLRYHNPCAHVKCKPIKCQIGFVPFTPKGKCCPTKCVRDCRLVRCAAPPKTCPPLHRAYKKDDECCVQCHLDCSTVLCLFPVCKDGQKPFTPKGKCCPICPPPKPSCGRNEVSVPCNECEKKCDPKYKCPLVLKSPICRKCICADGYYRNSNGRCVKKNECDRCLVTGVDCPALRCAVRQCDDTPNSLSWGCTNKCYRQEDGVCSGFTPQKICDLVAVPQDCCLKKRFPASPFVCKVGDVRCKGTDHCCLNSDGISGTSWICCDKDSKCVPGVFAAPGSVNACGHARCCAKGYVAGPNCKCVKKPPVCGPNESYLTCGSCDGTCKNPNPICPAVCRKGCFCNRGYVRDANGKCILKDKCPKRKCCFKSKIDATHVCGAGDDTCPDQDQCCLVGDVVRPRGGFTCCRRGTKCFDGGFACGASCCAPGYTRDIRQCKCVKITKRPTKRPTRRCGVNEEFKPCGACDGTCRNPNPFCTTDCRPGACGCKKGFVRDARGRCISQRLCPAAPQNCCYKQRIDGKYKCLYGDDVCRHDHKCCIRSDSITPKGGFACCRPGTNCFDGGILCGHACCASGYYRPPGSCRCVRRTRKPTPKPTPKPTKKPTPKCGVNEQFYACGACDRKCSDDGPILCPAICKIGGGCGCKRGFVRDESGECILERFCPSENESGCCFKKFIGGGNYVCKRGDVFCGSGSKCCVNSDAIHGGSFICCAKDTTCIPGGFVPANTIYCPHARCCKKGYGPGLNCKCVKKTTRKPTKKPTPRCGPHSTYKECGTSCPLTCTHPLTRPCDRKCNRGCFCNRGYVLNEATKRCVRLSQCVTRRPTWPWQRGSNDKRRHAQEKP